MARRERLDKTLAAAGVGTRKEVRALIKQGRISVDGEIVLDPAAHVDPERSEIFVDALPLARGTMTFMLNKPAGVVTAARDASHPTVLDLFPEPLARRLFPAGRLDKDTEGLLIVTSDGDLCHRLISPRHGVEKEYLARLDGNLDPGIARRFADGIALKDGTVTRPARLDIVSPGPEPVARVIVTEGKYHQVKRMFAACGLGVTALKRVRIGSLRLDESLEPGAYRELSESEIALLLVNP